MRNLKILGSVLLLAAIITGCKGKETLPDDALACIYEHEKFNEPIYGNVVKPDNENSYQNIVNNPSVVDESFIPQVYVSVGGFEEYNPKLLSYLVKNKIAAIKTANQTTINRFGQDTKKFNFVIYETNYGQKVFNDESGQYGDIGYKTLIGQREFISIQSFTKTEVTFDGIVEKGYSVTFNYKIKPQIIGILELDTTVFLGQANIFLNKSTNKWICTSLSFNDQGGKEFINLINRKYPAINDQIIAESNNNVQLDGNNKALRDKFIGEWIYNGKDYRHLQTGTIFNITDFDETNFRFSFKAQGSSGEGSGIYEHGNIYTYGALSWPGTMSLIEENGKSYIQVLGVRLEKK